MKRQAGSRYFMFINLWINLYIYIESIVLSLTESFTNRLCECFSNYICPISDCTVNNLYDMFMHLNTQFLKIKQYNK